MSKQDNNTSIESLLKTAHKGACDSCKCNLCVYILFRKQYQYGVTLANNYINRNNKVWKDLNYTQKADIDNWLCEHHPLPTRYGFTNTIGKTVSLGDYYEYID